MYYVLSMYQKFVQKLRFTCRPHLIIYIVFIYQSEYIFVEYLVSLVRNSSNLVFSYALIATKP